MMTKTEAEIRADIRASQVAKGLRRPDDGTRVTLPDEERGRSAYDLARLDKINARLARGYKPHRGKSAEDQRDDDLRRREELERQILERAEDRALEHRLAEASLLAAARGDIIESMSRPGEKSAVIRRQSGLDWLWNKGRIEPQQMLAGLRYGDLHRRATDVSLRSCVAGMPTGGGDHAQDLRLSAQDELAEVKSKALRGHEEMIWVCDKVAGEGKRIRSLANGEDARALKLEAVLCVALDLVARHYGIKT